MTQRSDYYSARIVTELKDGGGSVFGQSTVWYELRRHRDVTNLGDRLGYLLAMKQRIIVPNQKGPNVGPTSCTSYDGYPAILVCRVSPTVNNAADVRLRGLFPRTLNSSVSASISSSDGSTQSSSDSHTSGSSDTNINTFGVAISGGFFGPLPVGNLGVDYSHSWEKGSYSSDTKGSSAERMSTDESGESMSIKDWSSYGLLDAQAVSPTWIWGQSYPWDVIQYNQTNDGRTINLPSFVKDRLMSGTLVLPPSQLSLFGIDFTMRAVWLVDFPNGVATDETVTFAHEITSYTASHQVLAGQLSASLQSSQDADSASYQSPTLSMSAYALDPILGGGANNGAAIGFTSHRFSYPPSSPTSTFKIISPANNMQVTGIGFDGVLTTTFPNGKASVTISFKVADTSVEYALLLMHWIEDSSAAVALKCTINQLWTSTIYVDAVEGQGGQNNVSVLQLRNTDFTSINLHDYLKIGNNEIAIDIAPADAVKSAKYTLFAAAIGQA